MRACFQLCREALSRCTAEALVDIEWSLDVRCSHWLPLLNDLKVVILMRKQDLTIILVCLHGHNHIVCLGEQSCSAKVACSED